MNTQTQTDYSTCQQLSALPSPNVGESFPNKPATIVRFSRRKLPPAIMPFDEAAKKLMALAFPASSLHATARLAAQQLSIGVNTAERILRGETTRIDAKVLFGMLQIYHARTGQSFPIGGGFEIAIFQRVQP